MKTIAIPATKLMIVFRQGELPAIDPARPEFALQLGAVAIRGTVNPKAARKQAAHQGGAVLQGRLTEQNGKLVLTDGGFTFIEPRPPEVAAGAEAKEDGA